MAEPNPYDSNSSSIEAAAPANGDQEAAKFFDLSLDLLCIADMEGRFRRVNPAFSRTLGWSARELLATPYLDLIHPDDLSRTMDAVAGLREGRELSYFRNRFRTEGGSYRRIEWTIHPAAETGLLYCAGRDITDQHQLERRIRCILESTSDSVFALDSQWRFTYLNRRALDQISGGRDLLGMTIWAAFPEIANNVFETRCREAMATQKPVSFEQYYSPLNAWFEVHTYPSPDLLTVFFQDVTERHRTQAALRQSEERLEHALEATEEGLWEWNVSEDRVYLSPRVYAMLGYQEGELPLSYEPWRGLMHPDDAARVRETFAGFYTSGNERLEIEFRASHKDGGYRWMLSRGKVLERTAEGAPSRMVGTLLDIGARKDLEAQLLQSQKMEAVGRLAGGIAHDFNNLLTVINGYTSVMLDQTPQNDRRHEQLRSVLKAGEKAAALTQQLLAFSRRQVMQPVKLDMNEVLRGFQTLLCRLVPENIAMQFQLQPDLPPVRVDRSQIEQVVMNLVVNARDAMPAGGRLTIQTEIRDLDSSFAAEITPGGYVELSVTDTGIGMEPEVLSKIFEPFFTTKPKGKGTGLGLSTVQGVVKQSGGHVSVESDAGRGTTFRVYLPVSRGAVEGVLRSRDAMDAAAAGEQVLIIEDDPGVRAYITVVLARLGYRVFATADGLEALQTLRQLEHRPDLIITDLVLPGMGGVEIIERVRTDYPAMRTIYMSGYDENAAKVMGNLDSQSWFLPKPFSLEALAAKVRQALSQG